MGDFETPFELSFNDHVINILEEYGFYHLSTTGLNFFIAATNKADSNIEYLFNHTTELIGSGFIYTELIELKKLSEIDFTLRNWK